MKGQFGIVILLHQQGIVLLELTDMRQRWNVNTPRHFQVVVVDVFMGRHVGAVLIEVEKGMDEVGLVLLEHISCHIPFLHDELAGNFQLVKDEV